VSGPKKRPLGASLPVSFMKEIQSIINIKKNRDGVGGPMLAERLRENKSISRVSVFDKVNNLW
jgi:hypothetical protein